MTPVRCVEPDCIRPAWRGGLCWWCYQQAQATAQNRLDLAPQDKDSLDTMTEEDAS